MGSGIVVTTRTDSPHEGEVAVWRGDLVPLLPPSSVITVEEEMVGTFLQRFGNMSIQTERAYRKEITRLVAWLATKSAGTSLRTVSTTHINAYIAFLRGAEALAHPGNERGHLLKKGQALGDASVKHAKTLLGAFFSYLVKADYRPSNPVALAERAGGTRKAPRGIAEFRGEVDGEGTRKFEHILSGADMKMVGRAIAALAPPALALPDKPALTASAEDNKKLANRWWRQVQAAKQRHARQLSHYYRCRWIIMLGTLSFLRLSEMTDLQMCDFTEENGRWTLYIHAGKGATTAVRIKVPNRLIDELVIYRRSLGMLPVPRQKDGNPAIMPIYRKIRKDSPKDRVIELPGGAKRIEKAIPVAKRLSESGLYAVITQIFENAADLAPFQVQRDRLRAASPHWLRHTGITMALDAGESLRDVQTRARHSDPAMTAHYDHGRQNYDIRGWEIPAGNAVGVP